jgi:hypothetical protein
MVPVNSRVVHGTHGIPRLTTLLKANQPKLQTPCGEEGVSETQAEWLQMVQGVEWREQPRTPFLPTEDWARPVVSPGDSCCDLLQERCM